GNYTINNLDPGSWSLVATAPGYGPNAPVVVAVVSNQTTTAPTIRLVKVAPGSLSGLVTRTSDNAPLEGVTITVKDQAGRTIATTTTGPAQTVNGYTFNYKFDTLPAGVTYVVSADKSGFTPTPASQNAAVISGVE